MTVKELKEILEDIPDDYHVTLGYEVDYAQSESSADNVYIYNSFKEITIADSYY